MADEKLTAAGFYLDTDDEQYGELDNSLEQQAVAFAWMKAYAAYCVKHEMRKLESEVRVQVVNTPPFILEE